MENSNFGKTAIFSSKIRFSLFGLGLSVFFNSPQEWLFLLMFLSGFKLIAFYPLFVIWNIFKIWMRGIFIVIVINIWWNMACFLFFDASQIIFLVLSLQIIIINCLNTSCIYSVYRITTLFLSSSTAFFLKFIWKCFYTFFSWTGNMTLLNQMYFGLLLFHMQYLFQCLRKDVALKALGLSLQHSFLFELFHKWYHMEMNFFDDDQIPCKLLLHQANNRHNYILFFKRNTKEMLMLIILNNFHLKKNNLIWIKLTWTNLNSNGGKMKWILKVDQFQSMIQILGTYG